MRQKVENWINPTNGFILMAIALRGYSLYNCLGIQIAMFGELTAWIFTIIIEAAALLILYLLVIQKSWKFVTGFLGYIILSFLLVFLNDASLNHKTNLQQAEIETKLLDKLENLKKSQKSQFDIEIAALDFEIKKNNNNLDKEIPKWFREYLLRRNKRHNENIEKIKAQKTAILSYRPKNVRDLRKYLTSHGTIGSNSGENQKEVLLNAYDRNALDLALRESWGMSENRAKKIYRLIMAIIVEILIFGFAIVPKISKKAVSKSQNDTETKKETVRKSQSNGRRKINSIEDLRQNILSQLQSTGKMPYKRGYNKKWHYGFDRIKEELEDKKILETK